MKKMMIMVAMVLGLLMAGKARAEGAWVLWQWEYGVAAWNLDSAFPEYKQCIDQIKKYRQNLILNFGKPKWENEWKMGWDNYIIEWKCLPQSIDPRKVRR